MQKCLFIPETLHRKGFVQVRKSIDGCSKAEAVAVNMRLNLKPCSFCAGSVAACRSCETRSVSDGPIRLPGVAEAFRYTETLKTCDV